MLLVEQRGRSSASPFLTFLLATHPDDSCGRTQASSIHIPVGDLECIYIDDSSEWISAITAAPSPTAADTRLVDDDLTSPTAKTVGTLVW